MKRIKYDITKAELHENPFCIYLFAFTSALLTPIIINICMYYILFLIQCLPPNYVFTISDISLKKMAKYVKLCKEKVRNSSSHHPTSICLRKLPMIRLTPRFSSTHTHTHRHTHTHTRIHSVFLLHNGILTHYCAVCSPPQ